MPTTLASELQDEALKTVVILRRVSDWDAWIYSIKTIANAYEIWPYVNPSSTEKLEEPVKPSPRDVNPEKETFSALSAVEIEEFRLLRADYENDLRRFERKRKALTELSLRIQSTISLLILPYTFDCDSVSEILRKLEKRFKPTPESRELDISERYNELFRPGTFKDLDRYLDSWEFIYDECVRLEMPEAKRAVRDLIRVANGLNPGFSSYWRNEVRQRPDEIDLHDLVRYLRHDMRDQAAGSQHTAVFATFQKMPEANPRKCLCGETHAFRDCPYIMPELRKTAGEAWKPEIQADVDQKIRVNVRLQEVIARLHGQKGRDNMPTVV